MLELLPLSGLWLWTPRRFEDPRGWFSEIFSERALGEALGDVRFVQENVSFSRPKGVVRGLHFQTPPMAQAKFLVVLKGALLDVVVDLRRSSPTYGRHVTVELSAATGRQIFMPVGFAHGFVTLEPETQILYKVSAPYSPAHEQGIFWRDPALGIDWGIPEDAGLLSEKDLRLPLLADLPPVFD